MAEKRLIEFRHDAGEESSVQVEAVQIRGHEEHKKIRDEIIECTTQNPEDRVVDRITWHMDTDSIRATIRGADFHTVERFEAAGWRWE